MPELPEVETIRRVLENKISGRKISQVELRVSKLSASRLHRALHGRADFLVRHLQGRRIATVRRRAKYLVLDLDQGKLIVHLGMTGQIFAVNRKPAKLAPLYKKTGIASTPLTPHHDTSKCGHCERSEAISVLPALPDKHTHLILTLSDGTSIFYRDIRKFGSVRLLSDGEAAGLFANLGPEPLGRDFTPRTLQLVFAGKQASVKALLLNQRAVAGLGNIYADEALFRAKIGPRTPGRLITPSQAGKLHQAIRRVLTEAIRFRGTSMSDYYDPESRKGGFQDRLKVYGRAGQPCLACGRPLAKTVVAQRGTHWCTHCQK